MSRGTALVRRPSSRLAEGLLTYLDRQPVDLDSAVAQHRNYVAAVESAGWAVTEVPPADACPDGVFVEDTVVVCAGLAVLTRPGAEVRRAELAGTEQVVRQLGLPTAAITGPGTLDGGDVLQVGRTVYVGLGTRTNEDGIRQLAEFLMGRGRQVVPVPLRDVLHLKSAATALPDGTVLLRRGGSQVDPAAFPSTRPVDEESGCHVVPLGSDRVLIAASAPRTADLLTELGYEPVVVDIAEFEKLEGCVTCLSVLVPDSAAGA